MEVLIDVSDPQAFQTGIFKDLAQGQVGIWKYSENTAFIDGGVEKAAGWSLLYQFDNPVVALAQAFADNETRIYVGTADEIFTLIAGVATSLGSGYTPTDNWSFEIWGTWLIASNGIDKILVWKNTGSLADLAGTPTGVTAFSAMTQLNNFILGYAGTIAYWCSKGNPEDWNATDTNSAGDLPIRNFTSNVVAAKPLGNAVLVYSSNTMIVQSFVDSPNYFSFDSAPLNGIGALSANAIIPISNRHFGVCQKGFFETDGLTFNYIDRPQINRWFLEQIDLAQASTTIGVHLEKSTTVRWVFTCKDGSRRGVDFNYTTSAWTLHTVPLTAASAQDVFTYPVIAEGVNVGLLGEARDRGGGVLEALLQTFPLDAGNRSRYKTWHKIKLNADTVGDLEIRFGFSNHYADDPTWTEWGLYEEEHWLNPPQSSVYLTIQFRSNTLNCAWRLGVMQVFAEFGGLL